tara:strand:- start:5385 stop:6938 length:1554 start_codon:yes stop_codon:yes gene_type:complete
LLFENVLGKIDDSLEMKFRFVVIFISTVIFASFDLVAQTKDSSLVEESSQSETVTENPSERLVQSYPDLGVPIDPEKTLAVYVIPVKNAIGQPTLFAIRSGIKDAIEKNASLVILEMDTPGGELSATLDIMKTIDRFEGGTATFINEEAISAGAIIASVTRDIYFTPRATMGSSEVVTGSGQDVDDSMKRKINSLLTSKVDAYIGEYRYRSQVLEAMIDPDVELVIDGVTLSKEGKLLNLNARRAHENYGDPSQPLLGAGIHEDLDSLIESIADGREIVRHDFVTTWSLSLAAHLMTLSPVLLGLGILALLVEFKTPGFGVFGVAGIALIAFVNFGHNVAGLSGYEGLIIFVIGALLVFIEVVFFPGVVLLALPGIIMMLGGIVWSMADIWPQETPDFDITFDLFLTPIYNLVGGILIAVVLFMAVARFLPKSVFWDRMILAGSVQGASQGLGSIKSERPVAGAEGIAVSDLFPTGEIEIGGQRFEARVEVGSVSKGSRIRVLRSDVFGYFIEEVKE